MKKSLIIVTAVILTLTIGAVIVFATEHIKENKNEKNLEALMDVFSSTIFEFAKSDIIETKSVYGKLNGNGNGINYFGAVLIRKDAIDDIDALIAKLNDKFEAVDSFSQKEKKITSEYLEHEELEYDTDISEDTEYISIVFYNSQHPNSDLMDPAGH